MSVREDERYAERERAGLHVNRTLRARKQDARVEKKEKKKDTQEDVSPLKWSPAESGSL